MFGLFSVLRRDHYNFREKSPMQYYKNILWDVLHDNKEFMNKFFLYMDKTKQRLSRFDVVISEPNSMHSDGSKFQHLYRDEEDKLIFKWVILAHCKELKSGVSLDFFDTIHNYQSLENAVLDKVHLLWTAV